MNENVSIFTSCQSLKGQSNISDAVCYKCGEYLLFQQFFHVLLFLVINNIERNVSYHAHDSADLSNASGVSTDAVLVLRVTRTVRRAAQRRYYRVELPMDTRIELLQ